MDSACYWLKKIREVLSFIAPSSVNSERKPEISWCHFKKFFLGETNQKYPFQHQGEINKETKRNVSKIT